jgi:hypothetical protein
LAFSARRSMASYAERARLGSRRYSARRASATSKWLSGTGSSPGLSDPPTAAGQRIKRQAANHSRSAGLTTSRPPRLRTWV